MKSNLILLLTEDTDVEKQLAEAASETGAGVILAQDVGEAIQIVCTRREIDLVIVDFDDGCHGMTLLSALNLLRDDLPIVAVTSTNIDYIAALAYANGAAACLVKPINATELEIVIRALSDRELELQPA